VEPAHAHGSEELLEAVAAKRCTLGGDDALAKRLGGDRPRCLRSTRPGETRQGPDRSRGPCLLWGLAAQRGSLTGRSTSSDQTHPIEATFRVARNGADMSLTPPSALRILLHAGAGPALCRPGRAKRVTEAHGHLIRGDARSRPLGRKAEGRLRGLGHGSRSLIRRSSSWIATGAATGSRPKPGPVDASRLRPALPAQVKGNLCGASDLRLYGRAIRTVTLEGPRRVVQDGCVCGLCRRSTDGRRDR